MNNLTTSISFSIYSNKGVYALLLGSGVSKPSGIPTGWDIVIDLIKKLALLNKEKCQPDTETWFKNKYHEEPDYSLILSKLVTTPSERVNFLKPYFEPNEQERENNLKQPTSAHKSIAKLVKQGYFKVIITTNFDRLLEKAIQDEGIEPTVIRHSNDIDGAIPLVHNNFTLIKLNGDYLDSRFLNTKSELSKYHKKLGSYLLRIINEYGILSCGWSARWDSGLVQILRQSSNFRYSSYWTYIGKCESELIEISNYRKGEILKIVNADSFFNEILNKIQSLETINDNHPLNSSIAIAQLKKYIPREENKILLYELLKDEREHVFSSIRLFDFSQKPHANYILPKLTEIEATLEILLPLIINGVYWCTPSQYQYFVEIISRISEPPPNPNGTYYEQTRNFYYYPTALLLYCLGITAIKVQKFEIIKNCFQLKIAENSSEYSDKMYLIQKINSSLIEKDLMNSILSTKYHTPISTHINLKIRPLLIDYIPDDNDFNEYFDVFEYLLSLNFIHLVSIPAGIDWAPWGQFQWRSFRMPRNKDYMLKDFLKEAEQKKEEWLPLKIGMFNGDYAKFIEVKEKLDNFLKNIYLF